MKSRIAFCLVMLMLFSAVLPLHAEYELPILIAPNPMTAQQFTDLPDDADAREAVLWAFDNGIVNGTAKGVFSPDMICSRAQAACMLYRLEGTPTFMNNNCFADVAEGSWYEKAVIWAAGKGIILGYDDGLFHPEDDLTREQFVTMLYRYAQYLHNYRWIAMDSFCGDPANFADTAEISDFAEDAYTWAISRYIFDKGTALAPKALCTRADAVSLIYRCFPYADADNWAYLEADKQDTDADVFFVNPTVFMGENPVWDYYDEATMSSFVGSINMEKGIYEENTRFFAPYYHQASFSAYYLEDTEKQTEIFEHIYAEVRESFIYYLENYNEGRPIILAGFSQGADMSIRLLKDCFKDENLQKQLIACYAIGWRITEEEM
ncbi:MAG: DUF3089 domain-containing protein, partial [Clostridia bacterium]|nr:DUF3089 domain-containing protein [Clostridia bacterium]